MTPILDPERASAGVDRKREDRRLLERYHRDGEAGAREALVQRFMPLAHALARRYHRGDEPMDDLMQVASVGLVKAIDRFDPGRGTAFSTYAVPTIVGELKRHFRDTSWAVHVPRELQERAIKVDRATDELHHRLGRSASTSELADELQLTSEEVLQAMEASSAFATDSLDEQSGWDDSSEPIYARALGTDDERLELVEHGAAIAPGIMRLTDRERLILHLRFVEDLTQLEIAERIGVSQMQVSRLLRRSLAQLRTASGGGTD
jgi:RNA polymerase sigma-B factor